jgi:hypothetical protein
MHIFDVPGKLMKVFMDTNVYVADFKLSGSDFLILSDAISRGGIQLFTSELIIEEACGKFEAQIDEFFVKLQSHVSKFKRFSMTPVEYHLDIAEEKRLFRRTFLAQLASWSVQHVNYPTIPHAELIRRAIVRRKPFDDKGSGYRDALIWTTLLELLAQQDDELAFVTQNTHDFLEGDSLHRDLIEDMDLLNIPRDRLKVFTSLMAFNQAIVLPRLQRLDDLFGAFAQDKVQGFSIRNWANQNLIELLRDGDWGEVLAQLEDTGASTYASKLLEIEKIEIDDVRQLSSGDILLSATLCVKIELSVDATPEEIFRSNELREIFSDDDLSFQSATTWFPVTEYVEIRLILKSDTMRVLSAEIDGASGGSHSVTVQHHHMKL